MHQTIDDRFTQEEMANSIEAQRKHRAEHRAQLTRVLPDIATEVTNALAAADIQIPIYFTIPSRGAMMSFGTPTDTSAVRACSARWRWRAAMVATLG
jgi:hypothetical protein